MLPIHVTKKITEKVALKSQKNPAKDQNCVQKNMNKNYLTKQQRVESARFRSS